MSTFLQVAAINNMVALEELTLDGCTLLTQLQLTSPQLRVASARACPTLATVRLPTAVPVLPGLRRSRTHCSAPPLPVLA